MCVCVIIMNLRIENKFSHRYNIPYKQTNSSQLSKTIFNMEHGLLVSRTEHYSAHCVNKLPVPLPERGVLWRHGTPGTVSPTPETGPDIVAKRLLGWPSERSLVVNSLH